MGERTPRRNNNIMFGSAEQLDYNSSMARDLNKRASNRLRLHQGNIEGHKTTNLTTLNYEMRQIKHELREITHTSGTFDHIVETIPSRAGNDTTRRRKKTRRTVSDRNARNNKSSALSRKKVTDGSTETQAKRNSDASRRKSLSLPTLPSMTSTAILSPRDPSQLTSRTDISRVQEPIEESLSSCVPSKPKKATQRRQSRRKLSLEARASSGQITEKPISVSVIDANGDTTERFRPVSPREASKADSSFTNLNLGAVKDKIQTRLSQPTNPLIGETEDDEEDPDVTPYMHVPPDGLPRTVYLLPPLHDLLQEAKKARYLRRPKKPLQEEVDTDDPDRELGIDEIFSKKE